jgi:hypothetical protein
MLPYGSPLLPIGSRSACTLVDRAIDQVRNSASGKQREPADVSIMKLPIVGVRQRARRRVRHVARKPVQTRVVWSN